MAYLFGDCELDAGLRELRKNGNVSAVEPKVFDLLLYLVENRDRLVGKDELNQRIWKGRFVSDASLSTCIKLARQAIGDSGKGQDYIRTVPRRGFRFVGSVEVRGPSRRAVPPAVPGPVQVYRVLTGAEASSGALRKTHVRGYLRLGILAVTLLALVVGAALWQQPWVPEPTFQVSAQPSIAVLPFATLSGETEQESFADGISEDLTTQLSKISGLFVISRSTMFQYKGRTVDIRQLAQDLGVRYVVEGSVRRGGNDMRINAQLIDAATGGYIWAETFDGPAGEVFALQDRINEKIVAALKVQLTPDELARVTYRGTEDVAAYDAFLRGERFRLHSKVRAYEEAIREYQRAIELDPKFGAAHAALGHVLWSRAKSGGGDREDVVRAQELANTALTLGEDPAARTLLAKFHLMGKGDYARAEAEARKAIAIDPNNSEGLATLAEVLIYADRAEVAIHFLQKAMRLDPGFPFSYQILMAQAQFEQKRYRDVINLLTTACEGAFSRSYNRPCRYYSASAHGHLGEIEAGRMVLRLIEQGWVGAELVYLNKVEISVAISFPFKNESSREHLIEGIRKVLQID